MKKEMTIIRMKILFIIHHAENKNVNAASVARSLHISKSTVSRAAEHFQKHKLMLQDAFKLTALGNRISEKYWEQKELIKQWLISDAEMDSLEAEDEAINMLLHTKEQTLDALVASLETKSRNCMFCDMDGFCEKCIDYLLDDGKYDIGFTFYKDHQKKHMKVSMANDGFIHPGKLIVKNGIGLIKLEAKKVVRNMPIGSGLISGQVDRMSYMNEHEFVNAVHEGHVWTFPVSCLSFTYNKGERILMGSALLKLSCSIGKMYMPESTAIFTMTLAL